MPLPGPTERKKHWQDIVYTPLVTAGTYTNPCVTVNEYGLVTGITSCPSATFYVVDVPPSLASIGSPANGDLAIVLDDSDGTDTDDPEALYVWDSDGGTGVKVYGNWRRLVSTADVANRMDYRQSTFGLTAINAIGTPVELNAIVKEVAVTITTAYNAGVTMTVRDSGGTTYANSTLGDINPQVTGTYIIDLSENDTVVAGTQLRVQLNVGALTGDGLAYIKVVNS